MKKSFFMFAILICDTLEIIIVYFQQKSILIISNGGHPGICGNEIISYIYYLN